MDQYQRSEEYLRMGLVGDRTALYRTSPSFKMSIDTLASILPLWVDGIAAKAHENDRVVLQAIELAKRSPMTATIPVTQ